MATAARVQSALEGRWSDDDYQDRMVAIACFAIEGGGKGTEDGWILRRINERHGVTVDVSWPCRLAVFPTLVDAVDFARHLRDRLNGNCRIGVNLAEFKAGSDGQPGSGAQHARQLMEQSERGGLSISAIPGQRTTTHLKGGDDGRDTVEGWRRFLFAGLQWGGLLGYFGAWCYGIYWMFAYYAEHKVYPCWPEFLCG